MTEEQKEKKRRQAAIRGARYREANRAKLRIRANEWRKANLEKVNSRRSVLRRSRAESARASHRKWAKNNPDKVKHCLSNWRKANPTKLLGHVRNRIARKAKLSGTFTQKEFLALCASYGNVCLACRRSGVKLTADHVVPVTAGGPNTIDNIQPLCKPCNSKKYTKSTDYRTNLPVVEITE